MTRTELTLFQTKSLMYLMTTNKLTINKITININVELCTSVKNLNLGNMCLSNILTIKSQVNNCIVEVEVTLLASRISIHVLAEDANLNFVGNVKLLCRSQCNNPV